MWHMATYGTTVLPAHPSMQMVTTLKRHFWFYHPLNINWATLPFLSSSRLSFGVRFIWSPAMEADSSAFAWWASKVKSFNSVVEGGKKVRDMKELNVWKWQLSETSLSCTQVGWMAGQFNIIWASVRALCANNYLTHFSGFDFELSWGFVVAGQCQSTFFNGV